MVMVVICSGGFGEGGDDGGCGGSDSGIHNSFCTDRNVNLLCRHFIAC